MAKTDVFTLAVWSRLLRFIWQTFGSPNILQAMHETCVYNVKGYMLRRNVSPNTTQFPCLVGAFAQK